MTRDISVRSDDIEIFSYVSTYLRVGSLRKKFLGLNFTILLLNSVSLAKREVNLKVEILFANNRI